MIQLNNSNITLTPDHEYFDANGKQYKGITKLIAKHITRNENAFDNVDPLVLKIATDYGNGVHKAVEEWINSVKSPISEFDKYIKELGIIFDDSSDKLKYTYELRSIYMELCPEPLSPIASEYIVSDNKNYASPIDIVAQKDDGVYLIDLKTTSVLQRKSVTWQLSIYKSFFEMQNPTIKVLGIGAIHIKNKQATLHDLTNDIIPLSEVNRLFEAEEQGILYGDAVSTDLMLDEDKTMMVVVKMEQHLAKIKEHEDEIKKGKELLNELVANMPPFSVKNELFWITKVAESSRTSVDSKKLREQYPDVFEEVKKESIIKSHVRFGMTKSKK